MKYFLITEDKKIVNRPQLINWYSKISPEKLKWGTYHEVSSKTVLYVKKDIDIYFPDILTFPFFMVSKNIKDILSLYEPNMGYRQIILIEREYEKVMQYFIPHLLRVDCLDISSQYSFDHSEVLNAKIDIDKVPDKCIFELDGVSKRQIVVRHDFLESILRRGAIVDFHEVEIKR